MTAHHTANSGLLYKPNIPWKTDGNVPYYFGFNFGNHPILAILAILLDKPLQGDTVYLIAFRRLARRTQGAL
jgi:hypothetical protein